MTDVTVRHCTRPAKTEQPPRRGLALPDVVLQKMYYDNPIRFMGLAGLSINEN
jgi:hypothetical protein